MLVRSSVCLTALLLASTAAAQPAAKGPAFVPGEILVKPKVGIVQAGADYSAKAKNLSIRPRGRLKARFDTFGIEQWELPPDADVLEEVRRLQASGQVELAEPNYLRYPVAGPTGHVLYTHNAALQAIGLANAWNAGAQGQGATVAIIDDAFDTSHQDLQSMFIAGQAFFGSGVSQDVTDVTPTTCGSNQWQTHGTQVAGMVRAVAPLASIMPLKVGCVMDVGEELQAIQYAVNQGAHIINISYAGPDFSQAETDTLQSLNVLVVASAGNYHGNNDVTPMYPASLDVPNVVSVAASDSAGDIAHWSHWGATGVDLAAPGVGLYTTDINGTYVGNASGTSFSAPVVAGVAALVRGNRGAISVSELKAAVLGSVSPISGSFGRLVTDGRVNALGAVNATGPVVVIKDVQVNGIQVDGISLRHLSPGESTVNIIVENVGPTVADLKAELISGSDVTVLEDVVDIGTIGVNSTGNAAFTVSTGLTDYLRLPFALKLTVNGTPQTRRFILETGELDNYVEMEGIIQKDRFDEQQTYHFDVPAGAEDLTFQLVYEPGFDVNREMGLAIQKGQLPPALYYRDGSMNATTGWVSSNGIGIEHFPIASFLPPTAPIDRYYVSVFNRPTAIVADGARNISYKLRACYSSEAGNVPPQIQLGVPADMIVEAGQQITLSATATDPDDDDASLVRWWRLLSSGQSGAPSISNYKDDTISFTAPSTGTLTFRYTASDDQCADVAESVVVSVRNDADPDPRAPVFSSSNTLTTTTGQALNFTLAVSDPNGDLFTVTESNLPSGAFFDKATLFFSWPNPGPVGDYTVNFTARDSVGYTSQHQLLIRVQAKPSRNDTSSVRTAQPAGGCSVGKGQEVDPTLWLLLAFALFGLKRRKASL